MIKAAPAKQIYYTVPVYSQITAAEYDLICELLAQHNRATAIRFIKNQYALSLIAAKSLIDSIQKP